MADMRRNAWAPVGLDVLGAQNSEEALNMAKLNWEVLKKKVFDENGKAIPNWFANTRSDDNSVLGMVGKKYTIVQNKDAFDFTDALIGEGIEFEKAGDWKKGSAIWLEAKFPDTRKILGDEVESHVVFVNSHDGKGSVKVCIVPTRLFCSNQLNYALKTAKRTWSAMHSSNIEGKIKEAEQTLKLANSYMDELEKETERLALQKVSDEQFWGIVNKIYPLDEKASARQITSVAEVKEGLARALKEDDIANFKGTALEKMYAVTDWVDHATPRRETDSYWNNNWMKVANGHPVVDKFYEAFKELA